MGDNIIDDGDLIVKLGGEMAGGETGQLVINDVSLTIERDNDPKHGIGNKDPVGMGYGNKTYSLSSESVVETAIADIVTDMYLNDQSPKEAVLRSDGALEASIGKIDWNSIEKSASDDGEVTLSIDADGRDVILSRD